MNKSKELKRKIDKLWKLGKKDLDKILKDTNRLVKKGEVHIKDISKKAEENLEVMLLSLQREKLYYRLGRYLSGVSKSQWTDSRTAEDFLNKIKKINREIKHPKKK